MHRAVDSQNPLHLCAPLVTISEPGHSIAQLTSPAGTAGGYPRLAGLHRRNARLPGEGPAGGYAASAGTGSGSSCSVSARC